MGTADLNGGAFFNAEFRIRHRGSTVPERSGVALSFCRRHMFWIPEGFAHGYLSLEEGTSVLYKATDYYYKDLECVIAWDDNSINVKWPEQPDLISQKDAAGIYFENFNKWP
ncbi:dTDP-4-dehydrorhamnose 3,5-epimerase family protein [Pseudomonas sp. AR5]|nr:dTDP-4-dehydrorhamnose 3,5-epimerase family protein [Pseudomonas sp. AR5]